MAEIKPDQIRIRIAHENAALLDKLGKGVLSRTDIATYILNAACEAIRNADGRITMPPLFLVSESLDRNPGQQ